MVESWHSRRITAPTGTINMHLIAMHRTMLITMTAATGMIAARAVLQKIETATRGEARAEARTATTIIIITIIIIIIIIVTITVAVEKEWSLPHQ